VPVLNGPGGGQFEGVKEIAVSAQHVCALKTDMTVWCWGDNGLGQLGIGDTSVQRALYPVRVTGLPNGVSNVITNYEATCAASSDGNAWCWGASWVLGMQPTLSGASSYVPVRVLTDATTPLSQVAKILDMAGGIAFETMCALKTDRTIWCWGKVLLPTAITYAAQLNDYNKVPVANVGITGRGCYLDAYGHKWNSVTAPQPARMTTRELTDHVPVPCP